MLSSYDSDSPFVAELLYRHSEAERAERAALDHRHEIEHAINAARLAARPVSFVNEARKRIDLRVAEAVDWFGWDQPSGASLSHFGMSTHAGQVRIDASHYQHEEDGFRPVLVFRLPRVYAIGGQGGTLFRFTEYEEQVLRRIIEEHVKIFEKWNGYKREGVSADSVSFRLDMQIGEGAKMLTRNYEAFSDIKPKANLPEGWT